MSKPRLDERLLLWDTQRGPRVAKSTRNGRGHASQLTTSPFSNLPTASGRETKHSLFTTLSLIFAADSASSLAWWAANSTNIRTDFLIATASESTPYSVQAAALH
uniref:Uncharacterized protein n=1 Tax=Coccidioides posadasii RMSCC 3488 TaxID=454284 RepID=A0A0J6FBL9_COCPO|nr:hypothetical protein CPAG_06743 [Coccidioides posadasii RMSCC 3488]